MAQADTPERLQRMYHQQIPDFCSASQNTANTGKIIFYIFIFDRPGRLIRDTRRKIPFCFTAHGIPSKMLTSEIDPQRILPISQSFMTGKRKIPAGAPVNFRKPDWFPELTGSRHTLFSRSENIPMLCQQINPRYLHIFIKAHHGSGTGSLGRQTVFRKNMPGQIQSIFLTPAPNCTGKGFDKH